MWKFWNKLENKQGFTLLESLLSLVINALVLLLVTSLFQTIHHVKTSFDTDDKNIEWHVFLNQVENDIKDKTLVRIQRNEVKLKSITNNDVITYEPWGAVVRRYRNGTGYVPMITKTKNTIFKKNDSGFLIETDFINGQAMRGTISIEKQAE